MARIDSIDVFVRTGSITFSGTNGFVYAGIGGREFLLDAVGNDFGASSQFTYIIGTGSNLKAQIGNELAQNIDSEDALALPCYLRFEPKRNNDKWQLSNATMTINPGSQQVRFIYPFGQNSVLLSVESGKRVYLRRDS